MLKSDEYTSINQLSDKFKIGSRAVRYRLDTIDEFLASKGFPVLERSHGNGIKLVKTDELISEINKFCAAYTPKNYTFSKEERKNFIKSELLQTDEPILISYLMSVLSVSKNTILRELDEIESFFEDYELKLIRKKKVGLYLEGDERHKRLALFKVNSEMVTVDELFNYIYTGMPNSKINNLQFDSLFADVDLESINNILLEAQNDLGYEFSDMAYGNLITHIVIMIKRIRVGKHLIIIDANLDEEKYVKEIEVSKKVVKKIEKAFDIIIPPSEVNYLALHILSAKIKKGNKTDYDKELIKVIKSMVREIEKIYLLKFDSRSKENLIEGLLLHLRPALNRINFNLSIENPLFDDVLKAYPELFLNTKIVCKKLENRYKISINDQEVSYIMMHFGATLKNVNTSAKPKKIVLVCASGIGTVNMLKSQIERSYHVEISDVIGVREVETYDKDYDYIISSINIPNLDKESFVYINAILMEQDYETLDKKLLKKNRIIHNQKSLLGDLLEVIEDNTNIIDEEALTLGIIKILSNIENN